jgi:hypothetical protein
MVSTIREDLVRSAGEAGGAPEGVVMVRYDFPERTGRMWMPEGLTRAAPLLAAYPYSRRGKGARGSSHPPRIRYAWGIG